MIETGIRDRTSAWLRSEAGIRASKVARGAFIVAIIGILVWRLSVVGWSSILEALPATPWFYVIWALIYAVLPTADGAVYRMLWGIPFWRNLLVFLRKRIYSTDVLAYSGEIYLYYWAKQWHADESRDVMRSIRDVTLLSAFASVATALILLAIFLFSGLLPVAEFPVGQWVAFLAVGVLVVAGLALAGHRLRHHFFSLSRRHALTTLAVHVVRILAVYLLQVAQWAVVFPEVSVKSWIILLVTLILVNQIPVIPNKDLIFIAAGVEMARWTAVSSAAVAALLLAKSALDKAANVGLYAYTSFSKPGHPETGSPLTDTGKTASGGSPTLP